MSSVDWKHNGQHEEGPCCKQLSARGCPSDPRREGQLVSSEHIKSHVSIKTFLRTRPSRIAICRLQAVLSFRWTQQPRGARDLPTLQASLLAAAVPAAS